jgi:hypothetical protein
MMRGVFHHGPDNLAHRLIAHHRTWRQWLRELLGTSRLKEPDRIPVGSLEPLSRFGKGRQILESPGVLFEIEIKPLLTGCPFNKPVKRLRHVGDLLRDGHGSRLWPKHRVFLAQNTG